MPHLAPGARPDGFRAEHVRLAQAAAVVAHLHRPFYLLLWAAVSTFTTSATATHNLRLLLPSMQDMASIGSQLLHYTWAAVRLRSNQ
jgi:hypothetical protein